VTGDVTERVADAPYTLRQIEEMLGLGRSAVAGLIAAGFVTPARGARNEYRFTFQDVVLLRTAHALRAAKIPPRRLLRSLRRLREQLPAQLPLSGLRITAVGNDVAVREGDAQREVESGQLLLDFEVSGEGGQIALLQRLPSTASHDDAEAVFAQGARLDAEGDRDAAEQAYRRALALDPSLADVWLNLGALLCEQGHCGDAVALFDEAVQRHPDAALLHFNRAIALEDVGRDADALASYERCLALEPALADAHFNAARLNEKLGDAQHALRHYSAYRRLMR
jgi:tetratricopeptide (TPR) repeat protein